MYRTRQHVDKHVANILGRVKDEKERNSRGYQIAKLYSEVREYEVAKRYLAGFLSVRENFAPAHKLLGQIYEGIKEVEKAIGAYKRSLDLDDKQKDVLLKICELYTKSDLDPERTRYWAERAEKVCPNNAIVFRLKERLYNSKGGRGDNNDLEALITSELVKRPKDAELRAKLLRLYIDTGRVNEAYTHAVEVEKRDSYPSSITWVEAVLDVFKVYREESGNVNGVFHRCLLNAHSRLASLTLDNGKLIDAANALYRFDQCLCKVSQSNVSGQEWEVFYKEMQVQFYLHAGNLLMKRAQQEHVGWTEASAMSAVCYLVSYSVSPPSLQSAWVVKAGDGEKKQYVSLHRSACYRASQAGHMLHSLSVGDKERWASKLQAQWVTLQGRTKIYDTIFTLRHMKGAKDTSFLMTSDLYMMVVPQVPSELQLKQWDKVAHLEHPDSLRHLVWLALHYHNSTSDVQTNYGFKVFADLQYETPVSLDRASPETLSQLDTQAFVYAVVQSTAQRLIQRHLVIKKVKDEPRLLPICLHEELCTGEQAEWWQTAYLLNTNTASENLGRLRLVLQRGLETIRLTGNHGMPVSLVIHLAQVFSARAEEAVSAASIVDHTHLQARAEYYWTVAVGMLQKLAQNQCIRSPKKRLFDDHGPKLTDDEIRKYIEDGRFFLACQSMHAGKNEEAIEEFGKLNLAEASYHVAEIYRTMADEAGTVEDDGESPQEVLLAKARDSLYLTLDRIQGDRHHKLTTVLAPEIDEIEARLNRFQESAIAPQTGRPLQEEEEEEEEDQIDAVPEPSTTILKGAAGPGPQNASTPYRQPCSLRHSVSEFDSFHHTRPSPERLDAQVRSLALSQDMLMRQLMERNDELMKQNKTINEELRQSRTVIEQLKTRLESYERMGPLLPPAVPHMVPVSSAMAPGVDCSMRPPPPIPPPPAAASPYYGAYRFPEYDYAAHTSALASPYSPHPHGYPMYAPLPPLPYGYPPQPPPQPAAVPQHPVPPQPHPLYQPQPPPQQPAVRTTQQEDEEDYYVYDDEDYENDDDDDDDEDEEPVPTRVGRVHRTGGNSRMDNQYNVPDSQLIQEWPYGNKVNLEGKSTLTYSPTHPIHQTGYFAQVAPPPHGQQMTPPIYGSPVPPPIGPGYFSSPERTAGPYAQRFQSPTHLGLPPHQGVPLVGLTQPPALTPPKPGFLGTPTVTSTAPSGVVGVAPAPAPPGTVAQGGMMTQGTGHEAALTGGTIYKMSMPSTVTSTTAPTSTMPQSFGTQFIMTMPKDGKPAADSTVVPTTVPPFTFGLPGAGSTTPGSLYGTPAGKGPKSPGGGEEDDDAADDSYQGPDFEPIIPLPDEVEVITGEEDEKVLFKARSKLFRFVEKQWKERGLGEIKILRNESTNRVRILMRREQVHKVCANHALGPDMTISLKSPAEKKVLSWQALDFTEGQPQMEQFCAKFKNEDIAQQFKDKFEEGVAIAKKEKVNEKSKPVEKEESKVKDSEKPKGSNLLDKFRPKAGSWNCEVCMINNAADVVECVACATLKPGAEPPKDDKQSDTKSGPKISFGAGGGFSFGGVSAGGNAAQGSFTFGNQNSASPGTFKFGTPSATSTPDTPAKPVTTAATPVTAEVKPTPPALSVAKAATPSAGFNFTGTPVKSFTFGGSTPVDTQKETPKISPPKFSFVPSQSNISKANNETVTSTTEHEAPTASTGVFTFGGTSGVSTFKFGEISKPASSTPAADMLKSIAEKSASVPSNKPADLSKGSVGGFTFSAKPMFEKKEETKEPEKKEEPKTNPFAGFSFGTPPQSAPSVATADSTSKPTPSAFTIADSKTKPVPSAFSAADSTTKATPSAFSVADTTAMSAPRGTVKETKTVDKKTEGEAKPDSTTGIPVPVFSQLKTNDLPIPVFGAKANLKDFGEKVTPPDAEASVDKESSGKATFGTVTKNVALDFSNIVGSKTESFSTKSDFKGFAGAGQAIFGAAEGASPSRGGDHEEAVEEYEPDVDFKPVIPLPDLVEVKTGEEDEEKLFGERAKLFRHDPDAKQWKERGVGQMKILKHKETGRCRILMRREQVLKLCANHTVTKDLKLQPMASSDRAWCWIAQDYSEGDVRVEQFACKFKTPEVAQMFKEAFEEAQNTEVVQATVSAPQKPPEKDSSKPSLAEMFALQKGEWECSLCMVRNKPDADTCLACETPNPVAKPSAKPEKTPQSQQVSSTTTTGSGFDPSGFKFGASGAFNFGSSDVKSSGTSNITFTPPQSMTTQSKSTGGFDFGSAAPTFGGFNFGAAVTPKKDAVVTPKKGAVVTPKKDAAVSQTGSESATPVTPGKADSTVSSSSTGYVFGKNVETPGFTFSGVTPSKPVDLSANRSPRSPGTGEDFYVNQEGEDSHIYFEPVVRLEKVEVKTGEEDETVLYCHRAKLFRFVSNEWKERGVGDVKILCHKETEKHRLLMRRDQVHKLCLNHYLAGTMELRPMANTTGKAWMWDADDFTEGEVQHQQFALRFKTKEIAEDFKKTFDESVEKMKNYSTPTKAKDDPSKQVSEADSTVAKKSLGSMFAAKEGEWDCGVCLVRNKADSSNCVACQTIRPGVKPTSARLSTSEVDSSTSPGTQIPTASNLGSFSFKLPATTPDTTTKAGFTFGMAGASAGKFSFGSSAFTGSVFGGSPPSTKPADEAGTKTATKGKSLLAAMLEQPVGDEVTSSTDVIDDDVIFVGEKKATPEQVAKARALKLPDHFYLYEDKPTCPGCLGCDDGEGKMVAKARTDDVVYIGEDKPTPDQEAKACSLQLPAHFYMYEDKQPCSGCRGCNEGEAGTGKSNTKLSSEEVKSLPDSTTKTPQTEGVFGAGRAGSGFSFAALAANTSSPFGMDQKTDDKPFSWQGAGSSLFQSSAQEGGDETEDGVAPSNDVHFEPLVNLPEVELKTGEEDEDVLYSHRARLYRFDNTVNQWKERGIGEIKLLKHRETGKIRVLLRREQVLKLACNHMLTTDMKLLPLQTSETSWCWFAVDIALGTPTHEHFAIKFKDKTIAQGFKESFEECQSLLSSQPQLGGGGDGKPAEPKAVTTTATEEEEEEEEEGEESFTTGAEGTAEGPSYQGDEYEEEEEEEDALPLFSKRATMFHADAAGGWKPVGMGDLEVSYDDDVNGARITMTTDAGDLVCNHIICQEYYVQCNEKKKFCEWIAKDFSTDDPVRRTFRIQFSSRVAVGEFRKIFQEGLELAADSEISEVSDHALTFSQEITIPEVVSMPRSGDDGGSQ